MNKFKVIEQVLSNLSKVYVDNNKKSSEFVEECDTDITDICKLTEEYNKKGVSCLFDTKEGLRVYRRKQKNLWKLIKQIRGL